MAAEINGLAPGSAGPPPRHTSFSECARQPRGGVDIRSVGADAVDLPDVFRASERTANTACLVTRDLRLVRTNAAWQVFADTNGADPTRPTWPPGATLLDVIAEPLRAFYARGFEAVRQTNAPWEHDYDCSTPDQFRTFRMIVYPQGDYLVITHALHVARAHAAEPHPPSEAYRQRGLIKMCCHCRRVLAPGQATRWDWVPAWVAHLPPQVSHGLCPTCCEYHYPAEA